MALTQREDADLRRLTVFHELGFLQDEMQRRLSDLRQRDRRAAVRPVGEALARRVPVPRPNDPVIRIGNPCSAYPA